MKKGVENGVKCRQTPILVLKTERIRWVVDKKFIYQKLCIVLNNCKLQNI